MPEVPVNQFFPGEDIFPPDEPQGHEDMLFAPKVPEKVIEEEKTPEQLRNESFHGEALSNRESYASPSGGRYSIALDDVCRYENMVFPVGHPKAGQKGPRVHTVVGRNCPHGMLETLEMQRAEQG